MDSWIQQLSVDSVTNISILLLTCCLIGIFAYATVTFTDKHKRPPGLPQLPLVGNLPNFMRRKLDAIYCNELAQKYGDVYLIRLGNRKFVVLNSYEAIHEALGQQSIVFSGRHRGVLSSFANALKQGIVAADYCSYLKFHLKKITSILGELGFGKRSIEERIRHETLHTVEVLSSNGVARSSYDPSIDLLACVSNVINSIVFDRRFETNDHKYANFLGIFHNLFTLVTDVQIIEFFPVFRYLPGLNRKFAVFNSNFHEFMTFFKEQIAENAVRIEKAPGEIRSFVSLYAKQSETDITKDTDLLYFVRDLFSAGTETVSVSLHWAMIYMANYPEVQAKVQVELDAFVLNDARGNGQPLTLNDKDKLPYTCATIFEVLRISSAVPLSLARSTTEDCTVKGFYIDEGTTILPNIWAVHMDPEYWRNPKIFDPERFLQDGKVVKPERFIPFCIGRRACLGEALGKQEMFLFFTAIMLTFSIRPPDGAHKCSEEGKFGLTHQPRHPHIQLTLRK